MTVEFNLGDLLTGLMNDLTSEPRPPKFWGESADLERVEKAISLYHEYVQLSTQSHADAVESRMFEPRIRVREHTDIHALIELMDDRMYEVVKEWRLAVAEWAVGGTENEYDDLRERMLKISEMGVIRHMLDKEHVRWASENATSI